MKIQDSMLNWCTLTCHTNYGESSSAG